MNKKEIIKKDFKDIQEKIMMGISLSKIYDEYKNLDITFEEFKILCKEVYNENKEFKDINYITEKTADPIFDVNIKDRISNNFIKTDTNNNKNNNKKTQNFNSSDWEIKPAFSKVNFITNYMWKKTKLLLLIKILVVIASIFIGSSVLNVNLLSKYISNSAFYLGVIGNLLFTLLITMPFWSFVLSKIYKNNLFKANKIFNFIIIIAIIFNVSSLASGYKDFKKIQHQRMQQQMFDNNNDDDDDN